MSDAATRVIDSNTCRMCTKSCAVQFESRLDKEAALAEGPSNSPGGDSNAMAGSSSSTPPLKKPYVHPAMSENAGIASEEEREEFQLRACVPKNNVGGCISDQDSSEAATLACTRRHLWQHNGSAHAHIHAAAAAALADAAAAAAARPSPPLPPAAVNSEAMSTLSATGEPAVDDNALGSAEHTLMSPLPKARNTDAGGVGKHCPWQSACFCSGGSGSSGCRRHTVGNDGAACSSAVATNAGKVTAAASTVSVPSMQAYASNVDGANCAGRHEQQQQPSTEDLATAARASSADGGGLAVLTMNGAELSVAMRGTPPKAGAQLTSVAHMEILRRCATDLSAVPGSQLALLRHPYPRCVRAVAAALAPLAANAPTARDMKLSPLLGGSYWSQHTARVWVVRQRELRTRHSVELPGTHSQLLHVAHRCKVSRCRQRRAARGNAQLSAIDHELRRAAAISVGGRQSGGSADCGGGSAPACDGGSNLREAAFCPRHYCQGEVTACRCRKVLHCRHHIRRSCSDTAVEGCRGLRAAAAAAARHALRSHFVRVADVHTGSGSNFGSGGGGSISGNRLFVAVIAEHRRRPLDTLARCCHVAPCSKPKCTGACSADALSPVATAAASSAAAAS
ncbi:hypothetical protein JKP88DRAFT_249842 [Tribonema minus]|uniref:Uncharacterized protein n=1 Tax=Tribonema minus TaxID=303371 RepID=A0A835YID9_9STRA|nr:hypothetical protein JKP88DRAFT_249842 [Tribonema minus]